MNNHWLPKVSSAPISLASDPQSSIVFPVTHDNWNMHLPLWSVTFSIHHAISLFAYTFIFTLYWRYLTDCSKLIRCLRNVHPDLTTLVTNNSLTTSDNNFFVATLTWDIMFNSCRSSFCLSHDILSSEFGMSTTLYIKPGLEMPKNTEWQKQISTKRARRISITAVISSGELQYLTILRF